MSDDDKLRSASVARVPDRLIEPPVVDPVAQEVAQIVAWLRGYELDRTLGLCVGDCPSTVLATAANAIKRGEYRPKPKRGGHWPFE